MILIIDCGYTNIKNLEQLVEQTDDFQTVSLLNGSLEEINTEEITAIVISHAHFSINEKEPTEYLDALKPYMELNKPVLGIGIGHHLLGAYYGAQTAYQPYRNESVEISIYEDDELFDKLPEEIMVIKDHAGTISIPMGFQFLASSDYSVNEAMKKLGSPIYGVQFLLEASGNTGFVIMDNFVNISYQEKEKKG